MPAGVNYRLGKKGAEACRIGGRLLDNLEAAFIVTWRARRRVEADDCTLTASSAIVFIRNCPGIFFRRKHNSLGENAGTIADENDH